MFLHQTQPRGGGIPDLAQVRQIFLPANFFGFLLQHFAVTDDLIHRGPEIVAQPLHITPFGLEGFLVEILRDQGQQLPAARMNFGQVGSKDRGQLFVFLQHPAITQEVDLKFEPAGSAPEE